MPGEGYFRKFPIGVCRERSSTLTLFKDRRESGTPKNKHAIVGKNKNKEWHGRFNFILEEYEYYSSVLTDHLFFTGHLRTGILPATLIKVPCLRITTRTWEK